MPTARAVISRLRVLSSPVMSETIMPRKSLLAGAVLLYHGASSSAGLVNGTRFPLAFIALAETHGSDMTCTWNGTRGALVEQVR
jgi:hypothetical protein